jgi:uncharacterized protein YciI
MPFFVLRGIDGQDVAATRADYREAHLAHVRGSGKTRIAGPLTDAAGEVCGSLLIVEAGDLAEAEAFSAADPYRRAGVWSSVEILPFRMTYVDLPRGEVGRAPA